MTDDSRKPLDKFLGVLDPYGRGTHAYDREPYIQARLVKALEASSWAEAQVYALLLIANNQADQTVQISWPSWEDHARTVGYAIGEALGR